MFSKRLPCDHLEYFKQFSVIIWSTLNTCYVTQVDRLTMLDLAFAPSRMLRQCLQALFDRYITNSVTTRLAFVVRLSADLTPERITGRSPDSGSFDTLKSRRAFNSLTTDNKQVHFRLCVYW